MQSYLSNRKYDVEDGKSKSFAKSIISAVRQGSILGALFFLLFFNDLSPNANVMKTILFADDTVLVQSEDNL